MTDKETDAFFAALAGKAAPGEPANPAEVFGRAAREELVARQAWDDAFASAPPHEPTEQDAALNERLIGQLRARGLLAQEVSAASRRPAGRSSVWSRWRDAVLGDGWIRPLALAASVAVVSLLVLRPLGDEDMAPALRGGDAAREVLLVPDAAGLQQRLVVDLTAAGATATATQIKLDPPVWRVVVEWPAGADVQRIRKILQDAGLQVPQGQSVEFDVVTRHQ